MITTQYNYYKTLTKYWTLSIDFLFTLKKLCVQPIHLCIESDTIHLSIGLLFIRIAIKLEKWEN